VTVPRARHVRDFAELYDEHVWSVYGFFGYRLSSRDEAEDLTQLTFERALRAWSRFDPARASARTWLLAIARNLLIDHYRRRQPIPSGDLAELDLAGAPDPEPGLGLAPDLELALQGLSERERELLALRYGGDLSGPEIAELTGLKLANVQQIISRALRRMRAELDAAESAASSAGRERTGAQSTGDGHQ
jgi:RNA polymerase sigma-70 factor (ECF subfamily)